jgi:hypothetical protein
VNVIAKASLFIMAGMGATWIVREATDVFGGGPASRLTQTGPANAQPAGTPSEVKPISREEMEAELRKAQAAIAAGGAPESAKGEGSREFRPTKPLPADLPVALPSDI